MQFWKNETQKTPGQEVMEERVNWGDPASRKDPMEDSSPQAGGPPKVGLLRSLFWRVVIGVVLLGLAILLYVLFK